MECSEYCPRRDLRIVQNNITVETEKLKTKLLQAFDNDIIYRKFPKISGKDITLKASCRLRLPWRTKVADWLKH